MQPGTFQVKRRVWVGLAAAVLVTAAWWEWNRAMPPVTALPAGPGQPLVRSAGSGSGAADRLVRERAELFDPTPLFFPTEWNYGHRDLPDRLRRQPGQVFGGFDPKPVFAEQNLKAYGVEQGPAAEKLSDVLTQGNEAPFAGFGRIDVARPALPERLGFLEIRKLGSVDSIINKSLVDVKPPRSDFAPLEFFVVVGSSGIIGEPVLTTGSGWEEVDNFFRSYLVKGFHLGERLFPGNYRVVVGP